VGCAGTLQDVCLAKNPLVVGLLSAITGSTLQDDIAAAIHEMVLRGRKILGPVFPEKHDSRIAADYERKTDNKAGPPGAN
jgi:hypothetical protein